MTDWIIFGDDWGRHPSTTQHLVRALPAADRVVWIDSIGMRTPRPNRHDAARLLSRLSAPPAAAAPMRDQMVRVRPRIMPLHTVRAARNINRALLGRQVAVAREQLALENPCVLAANPVAAYYLDGLGEIGGVGYLRLDDYARLPGVDPSLARDAERAMFDRADVCFGTARALVPRGGVYLPQGVDYEHFAARRAQPERVLGFFGLLAEWIDFSLIESVARSMPEWTLEFVGPVRHCPDSVRSLPNVRLVDAVPYADLPRVTEHWQAAWLPFEVSALTAAVNPLKLREYLAAGLPTCSTALPEVCHFDGVEIVCRADQVVAFLDATEHEDAAARAARSATVKSHSWRQRAAALAAQLAASSRRLNPTVGGPLAIATH